MAPELLSHLHLFPVWHTVKNILLLPLQLCNVKHLGYFNHIFRLSHLHQCDQGMQIGFS